jgi:polysaccharide export outer membrane protein
VLLAQAGGDAPSNEYRVGPGDVIEVTVEGRPELARLPTVQTSGRIFLPAAGEVEVRGLTVEEIAARLSGVLAEAQAGPDGRPRVRVRVREYQSQFVWLRGALNRPGRKPLRAGTRLVDALVEAGGLARGASGIVIVERSSGAFADGTRRRVVRLSGGPSPSDEELAALALPLRPGDTITATVQEWVSVTGGVARPGRFPFEESLTLAALVDRAGGRSGPGRVVVRRGTESIEADLDAIRDGRAPDVPLRPGDEVAARGRR